MAPPGAGAAPLDPRAASGPAPGPVPAPPGTATTPGGLGVPPGGPGGTFGPAGPLTVVPVVPGVPALPVPNPLTTVGDVAGGLFGGVSRDAAQLVLDGLTSWVQQGTVSLLGAVISGLDNSAEPRLDQGWALQHYRDMVGVAALFLVPLLLATAVTAIVRQDAAALGRAVGVHLPMAIVGTLAAVTTVQLSLQATDDLCRFITHHTGDDLAIVLGQLRTLFGAGAPGGGGFAVVLVCVLTCLAAFLLTIELVMRTAAVWVAVLFLPVALIGSVWPGTTRWTRRLIETLVVLVLSKFVVVAVISLAGAAVAAGATGGGLSALLSGTALLALAAAAPFALLRLVPIIEAGMIGHLEGVGRRSLSAGPVSPSMVANRLLAAARPDPTDPAAPSGVDGLGGPPALRGLAADGTQLAPSEGLAATVGLAAAGGPVAAGGAAPAGGGALVGAGSAGGAAVAGPSVAGPSAVAVVAGPSTAGGPARPGGAGPGRIGVDGGTGAEP